MIPVVITVYSDRSFTFITKTPPAAILLKKRGGAGEARSGSPEPQQGGQGASRRRCVRSPSSKAPDLNSATVEAAERMVMGTARSMGIELAGVAEVRR